MSTAAADEHVVTVAPIASPRVRGVGGWWSQRVVKCSCGWLEVAINAELATAYAAGHRRQVEP